MNVGVILGGGGEVGIAWEIGVLAGLRQSIAFDITASAVVAGTSAGAVVAALAATGRSVDELIATIESGQGFSPVALPDGDDAQHSGPGTAAAPEDMMRLLMSQEGTVQERAAAIGAAAVAAPTLIDADQWADSVRRTLGTDRWPPTELRLSSVAASTGATRLFHRGDGIDLASAVAASAAVPGFFPPVAFEEEHYIDGPRTPFSMDLINELHLDSILYIGLELPVLSNTDELTVLREWARTGHGIVEVTGGPGVAEIAAELMDPRVGERAAQIGRDDGVAAGEAVRMLLQL